MTDQDLQRLLQFYLACIDAEDRRSLRKKLSAIHRSVISPWDDVEPLFYSEAAEVLFDVSMVSDLTMLSGDATQGDPSERRFYGYPLYLDDEGFLAPLFFAEVQVDHVKATTFAMRMERADGIQLNHHMFRKQHAQPEELRSLQAELEGEFGSFGDRLRAAFDALGIEMPLLGRSPLGSYPKLDSQRNRWINRPILFKSERSPYTHHLRRELEALGKYPRLRDALGGTAAGAIAGIVTGSERRTHRSGTSIVQFLPVLPLNRGQERAAFAGLESPLTVVTGPPGTGKSQVVVDIIASCAAAGRPVLFASKNNKAVDVVRERLRAILQDEQDWTLRLGSRRVMEASQQEMVARLNGLRTTAVPKAPSPKLLYELDEDIAEARLRITRLETACTRYTECDHESRSAEALIDASWIESWQPNAPPLDAARIERLSVRADVLAGRRTGGIWLRIASSLFSALLRQRLCKQLLGITAFLPSPIRNDLEELADRAASTNSFEQIADALRRLKRLAQWRANYEARERALGDLSKEKPASELASSLEGLQKQRADYACQQLRASWTGRLAARARTVSYALDQYFQLSSRVQQARSGEFLPLLDRFRDAVKTVGADFPAWIVTSLSVRNAVPLDPEVFDLVIIDEASQCDIPSALPLLFRARRALVIGDPQQLRHISTLSAAEEASLAVEHGVAEMLSEWSYNECSLYAVAQGAIINRGEEPLLLSEHYRSHPDVIEFSNNTFYQGQLIPRTDLAVLRERLGDQPLGLFWHDVPGGVPNSSRSVWNEMEVEGVLSLLDKWAESGLLGRKGVDVGIVTPFRLQMERLEARLSRRPWWSAAKSRVTVGTAHRFQGDERDVMIFSPVVGAGMAPRLVRWVADTDQLLNVAITRARGALHVVGDLAACRTAGGHLGRFSAFAGDVRLAGTPAPRFDSPAEGRMAELLSETGLWFRPQHAVGKHFFDFFVVSLLGTRYDLEVDGRGHRTDRAVLADAIRDAAIRALGYKVLRVDARRVFHDEQSVRALLAHLP